MLVIGIILLLLHHKVQADCSGTNSISSSWNTGANGKLKIKVPVNTTNGWNMEIKFDKDVTGLEIKQGKSEACNGKVCTFVNKGWNKAQDKDAILYLRYDVSYTVC